MTKKLLTSEELRNLLSKWRYNNDQQAITIIIERNMGLVRKIASKFRDYNFTFEELEMIGMEKIWESANNFNFEDKGNELSKVFGAYLAVSIERGILREIKKNAKHDEVLSFSQSIGQNKDGKEQTLEDTLGTDDDMLINDVLSEIKSEVVKNALNSLTSKERKIILLRYGLEKDKCKTLEEVGEIFGVSRERIRQTEEKALIKMRHPRNTRKLKDFIED